MGTFSIILGFIALLGFIGVSFPVSQYLVRELEWWQSKLPNVVSFASDKITLIIIAVFAFVGILFFVPLISAGMTYNRSKRAGAFNIVVAFVALLGFIGVSIPASQFASKLWESVQSVSPEKYPLAPEQIAIIVIAAFVFIAILFFVPLLTSGLAYNRSRKLERKLRRRHHKEQ